MAYRYPDIPLSAEDVKFFRDNPQVLSPKPHASGNYSIPGWVVDSHDQLIVRKLRQQPPSLRKAPETVRARDSKQWIKKDNRYTGGVRKQRYESRPIKPTSMSRPLSQAQYQRHHLHLMNCVLGLRNNSSPFTLVLDDLNQTAQPLVQEFTFRAFSRNINVVYVSFESTKARHHPNIRYIPVWGHHSAEQVMAALENVLKEFKESLVIIDSLYDIVGLKNIDMTALFNLIAMKYRSTLIGVYHTDLIPHHNSNPYAPAPLETFKYMATTIITTKSLAHVLAAKAAAARSLPEPTFGLLQGAEGIVQCLNANDHRGIVLEAEFRRKSGRSESEKYFLRPSRHADYHEPLPGMVVGALKREFVVLLDQVPAYASEAIMGLVGAAGDSEVKPDEMESTFKLGLTEKQRQAREGVVLPYFDAQKNMGDAGEGGRILYDMGSEDDFDEEEDEI